MSSSTHMLALPSGTLLQQYEIESVLGTGAFGIVYKARHTHLDTWVAIKEYLPQYCATRDGNTVQPLTSHDEQEFELGIQDFLKEAKQLVKFEDHPSVIRCKDFFKMNGTAYLIMQLEHGLELAQVVKNHTLAKHPLSEQQVIALMIPILDGLAYIHSEGVLHRDIKPANIFVRIADNRPLLIDFGAAKQDYGHSQKTQNQLHTAGYAPLEQVESDGELGPWTDIHAVGAMMWRIICNANPPMVQDRIASVYRKIPDPAFSRLEEMRTQYSDFFIDAIIKAMAMDQSDRFQSAEEFKRALSATHEPVTHDLDDIITTRAPDPIPQPIRPTKQIVTGTEQVVTAGETSERVPKKDKFKLIVLSISLALVLLIGAFIFIEWKSEPIPLNLKEDIEIIHTLLTKVELDRQEIFSNQNVIDITKSLGNLDDASKKNVEILEASVRKTEVSIEENMTRARERTLALTKRQQNFSNAFDKAMTSMISETADAGMYEKSEFFKGLKSLVQEASELPTKAAKQSLIEKKL